MLGAFWLDLETPIGINYSSDSVAGKAVVRFEWAAVMYVGDVLGLQADNSVVQSWGSWVMKLAPSRSVKRARWNISGARIVYEVVRGDEPVRNFVCEA